MIGRNRDSEGNLEYWLRDWRGRGFTTRKEGEWAAVAPFFEEGKTYRHAETGSHYRVLSVQEEGGNRVAFARYDWSGVVQPVWKLLWEIDYEMMQEVTD